MPKLRCVTALLAFAALFGAACSGGEDEAGRSLNRRVDVECQ